MDTSLIRTLYTGGIATYPMTTFYMVTPIMLGMAIFQGIMNSGGEREALGYCV